MADLLRLASWNILANCYVREEWYRRCDPEALKWSQRRELLLRKLTELDADILCLQEVELEAFDFLEERLRKLGYRGLHGKKGQGKPDGCATFFKENGPALKSSQVFHYDDREKGGRSSGHLALISSFDVGAGTLRVANTHLKWDDRPREQHIGYRQAAELRRAQVEPDTGAAWVICGDLNAQPGSFVVEELLLAGLGDAYGGKEQPTCNPNGKAKRIDYILHSARIGSMTSELTPIDDDTPLPSEVEPSDHLAILATLSF